MDLRAEARHIFLETLRRVDLRTTMRNRISMDGAVLRVGQSAYDLAGFRHVFLVAVGKAAVPMAETMVEILEPALTPRQTLQGVVVGTSAPKTLPLGLFARMGSHPFPDSSSADAADLILHLLRQASEDSLVLFLISGGSSAMVETPLDPALPLGDVVAFYRTLVHSGISITAMNLLRKHLSAVKGGRLALAASRATQCTLLVSDVPPGQPDIVGSGLTLPDPTTLADCRYLLEHQLAKAAIPSAVRSFLTNPHTPETPKPDDPAFRNSSWHVLLSSEDLCAAAHSVAQERGFRAEIDLTPDDWHFQEAATFLLNRMDGLARKSEGRPVCLISAGEIAVPVSAAEPGLGGRNQHFALHCALALEQRTRPLAVLSAGSDGADGNSPAAGAVVDQTTLSRAEGLGLDPAAALAGYDSFSLFSALGDAVVTGPTSNNLRDLRLLLSAAGA